MLKGNQGATQPGTPAPGFFSQHMPGHRHNTQHSTSLPPPHELASRIEEARTSAKLLNQMVQSTPGAEVIGNDLLKEFSDRCKSASRSIQNYIAAENPSPDADTALTLIETNDQLSMALSKHNRAVLNARKAAGQSSSPAPEQSSNSDGVMGATIDWAAVGQSSGAIPASQLAIPHGPYTTPENPFDDSNRAPSQERGREPVPASNGVARGPEVDDDEEESPQQPRHLAF